MNRVETYKISNVIPIPQIHDEIINGIEITGDKLILKFNDLNFSHKNKENYSECEMIFYPVKNMSTDSWIKITNKYRKDSLLYMDDFVPIMKKKNISLKVADVFLGYDKIFITGKFLAQNCRNKSFQLTICTENISYNFYN